MDRALVKELAQKYPEILRNSDLESDPYAGGSLLGFGLECGDGWYQFLDAVFSSLSGIYWSTGMRVIPRQVKEKFGTLRFYYDIEPDMRVLRRHVVLGPWLKYHSLTLVDNILKKFLYPRFKWGTWKFRLSTKAGKFYPYRYRYTLVKRYDRESSGWAPSNHTESIRPKEISKQVYGIMMMADRLSENTCENCGRPARTSRRGSWVATLCDNCSPKEQEDSSDVDIEDQPEHT